MALPRVIGGRYGLSSKEYTPAMAKAVLRRTEAGEAEAALHGRHPRRRHAPVAESGTRDFDTEAAGVTRAVFYGLGADGTVGATKNTVKIIGESTPLHAQGYFVYDSKKSGAITVSHLRFGPEPIESTYLIGKADFVACHQFEFMEKLDVLELARPGATFLLNSPVRARTRCGASCRARRSRRSSTASCEFFVVDALAVARQAGLVGRINTVTQACFFAISGILPRDEAIDKIKDAIRKTYGKRGETVLARNFAAVDGSLAAMAEVKVPDRADSLMVAPADRAEGRAGLRAARDGDDAGRQGRPAAGVGAAGRRHVPDRHHPVGEAQHRAGNPDLGRDDLHAVRDLPAGVPARGDPHDGVLARGDEARSVDLQGGAVDTQGQPRGHAVQPAGGAGGLHRLRRLRRRLPDAQQAGGQAQGDQHGAEARAPRGRARQLRVLPQPARRCGRRSTRSTACAARSCASRCSSTRARALAAARRRT